jgi:hypothetical protein
MDKDQTRILYQNEKYKITQEITEDGYVGKRKFVNGHGQSAIIYSKSWYFLDERYWFFGWSWRRVSWSNDKRTVQEWKDKLGLKWANEIVCSSRR